MCRGEEVKVELVSTRSVKAARHAQRSTLFVRGPIPMSWLTRAARLPGKALHVGLLLWFRVGCEKSVTVRLTRSHCNLFGLTRHVVYRALKRLEEAGLVEVSRHRGRCPIVTINRTALPATHTASTEVTPTSAYGGHETRPGRRPCGDSEPENA